MGWYQVYNALCICGYSVRSILIRFLLLAWLEWLWESFIYNLARQLDTGLCKHSGVYGYQVRFD